MNALLQPARLRAALPVISLLIVVLPMFYLQPQTLSYFGINMLMSLAVPIVLATMSQMCVITVNDLDLSMAALSASLRASALRSCSRTQCSELRCWSAACWCTAWSAC